MGQLTWYQGFKKNLQAVAEEYVLAAEQKKFPARYFARKRARHVLWLIAVDRIGEAHAILVNHGYTVISEARGM